jgi:hypothetical protein
MPDMTTFPTINFKETSSSRSFDVVDAFRCQWFSCSGKNKWFLLYPVEILVWLGAWIARVWMNIG